MQPPEPAGPPTSRVLLWIALVVLVIALIPVASLTLQASGEGLNELWGYFCLAPTLVILGLILVVGSQIARSRERRAAAGPAPRPLSATRPQPAPPREGKDQPAAPPAAEPRRVARASSLAPASDAKASAAPKEPRRRCPKCRKLSPREARFCQHCGKPLRERTRKA